MRRLSSTSAWATARYRQARDRSRSSRASPRASRWSPGLQRLLVDTESWRRPEYLAKLRERDQQHFEMIAALTATLTPEQRAHLQKRLRGFMRDITELTASN